MPKTKATQTGYHKDSQGKEFFSKSDGIPLIMEWEKPYLEACIDQLHPQNNVLEIGFGLGYVAQHIQSHRPKHHVIIEAVPEILQRAKSWAQKMKNVEIIEGHWLEKLRNLGQFDSIFFHDSLFWSDLGKNGLEDPAMQGATIKKAHHAREALREALDQLKSVKFSDQEVKDFAQTVLRRPDATLNLVLDFLNDLEEQGNITEKQRLACTKELKKQADLLEKSSKDSPPQPLILDKLTACAEICLNQHMRPGAKIAVFLESPSTKIQNKDFQSKILARPDVKFSEKIIPVSVPSNCPYYQGDQGVMIFIEKKR